jgi:hypothetical protein
VTGFVLAGVGLSVLMLGLSALGGHLMTATVTTACIAAGILLTACYGWYARRAAHPVLDLRLFRHTTFYNGVLIGSLFRVGVGATPFLLPLLLQLGFGLDPLQSGLLTCATAVGAMFMKTLTVAILKRWGFRRVLTFNALLASASVMSFGLFTAATPHLLIVLLLVLSGCLRSLQFTGLHALAFADITPAGMGQAAAVSSMAQRLSQSVGIVVGAYALQLSSHLHDRSSVTAADFWPAFLAVGLLSLSSAAWHRRLAPDAGAEVSRHSGK